LKKIFARAYYGVSDTLQEAAIVIDPVRFWRWELRRRGHKKEPEFGLIPFFCRAGGTMVDIGSNKGAYLALSLEHVQNAVAFEPNPRMVSLLRKAFRNLGVTINHVALGASEGEVTLRIPRGQPGRSTIQTANTLNDVRGKVDECRVGLRTLDSFGLRGVSFVKIDVEGAEVSVLRGGAETLRRERPIVFLEAEERHQPGAVAAVSDFFAELGYEGCFLHQGRMQDIESFCPKTHQGDCAASYVRDFTFLPDAGSRDALTDYWSARAC
jgi:FkbM family methyltransferase